jgi:hypothetical protein
VGSGFVFFFYLLFIGAITLPASVAGLALGWIITSRKSRRTRWLFRAGGLLLPIIGAIYLIGSILAMVLFGQLTDRDIGFGDQFTVPLRNHYEWNAINEPDSACIYDTRDRRAIGSEGNVHVESGDREAFSNVVQLQQRGDWLLGAYAKDPPPNDTAPIADHWFLFNTKSHERVDVASEQELRSVAISHGLQLDLQASESFYANQRWNWRDGVALLILVAIPLVGLAVLLLKARKIWCGDTGPVANHLTSPSAHP